MIRMLKLVISNEIAQVQPSAVPQVGKFRAGEVLECRASKERVLVIGCDKQGSAAVLMPLPDGELYETRIEDMKGWESSYLAGPRLVELCRKSSDKVEWSCYMPNFDTALALWQKVDAVRPRQFKVLIHTQHPDELAVLESCGYFGSKSARTR
jgi:hypothetical protein